MKGELIIAKACLLALEDILGEACRFQDKDLVAEVLGREPAVSIVEDEPVQAGPIGQECALVRLFVAFQIVHFQHRYFRLRVHITLVTLVLLHDCIGLIKIAHILQLEADVVILRAEDPVQN